VNNELEPIWKEMNVAQFNVLCRYLNGGTEENMEQYQI
jgi:hypothetical protein